MKAIKPTAITSAMLVSTTATETYSAWNAATAYVAGNIVLRTATERLYERLVSGTTATAPESDTINWLDIGPSNKWAMFDNYASTQTSQATPLTVVVKPGLVNSLALFSLEGTSLAVTVRDGLAGSVVYSYSQSLDGTVLADWYQYFFEPYDPVSDVVLTDLPPYGDAHITVAVSGATTAKCGIMAVGTVYPLGDTMSGASASITDYSVKSTDAYGTTSFVVRAYSKRMSAKFMLDNAQLNKVQRVLSDLRATPCVWVGTSAQSFAPLTVFGFYRDFSIDVAYPTMSYCSMEIEGLT